MKSFSVSCWGQIILAIVAAARALPGAYAQHSPSAHGASDETSTHILSADALPIYTWVENTPAWDRKLHVSGYRTGCDTGDPEGCIREAEAEVKQRGLTRIFVSMDADPIHTPIDALNYSRLSLSHPYIVEAGMDDFVDRYQNLFSASFDPRPWLRQVIQNVKARNSNLAFGITLYEDELDSPYVRPPYLPVNLTRSVDIVHLFLHYRTDAPDLPQYVARARVLFPHATVIAGLYAYDRIDYISCSPSAKRPCSPAEEIRLYDESASIAAKLLKQGRISGIELYPGFFGMESEWYGWKHADYCAPKRVLQCIQNTRQMRADTAAILARY